MKEISASTITETVAELAISACCHLSGDTVDAVTRAQCHEPSSVGRDILNQLLENATIAATQNMPICQGRGLTVIFADLGQDVHITGGDVTQAVNAGVRKGYTDSYLRKSSQNPCLGVKTLEITHPPYYTCASCRAILCACGWLPRELGLKTRAHSKCSSRQMAWKISPPL